LYGKIFDSMYDGTLSAHWQGLVTFQQMIVLCDASGIIDITPPALSRRTGIPLEIITEGLEFLEAPDPFSLTQAEGGKRIVLLNPDRPWGWLIVNHKQYRDLATKAEKTAYDKARYYQRKAAGDIPLEKVENSTIPQHSTDSTHADADADADADAKIKSLGERADKSPPKESAKKRFVAPTLQEVREFMLTKDPEIPEIEAEVFFDFYESKGWMVGKNKMQVWRGAAAGWVNRRKRDDKPARQSTDELLNDFSWAGGDQSPVRHHERDVSESVDGASGREPAEEVVGIPVIPEGAGTDISGP